MGLQRRVLVRAPAGRVLTASLLRGTRHAATKAPFGQNPDGVYHMAPRADPVGSGLPSTQSDFAWIRPTGPLPNCSASSRSPLDRSMWRPAVSGSPNVLFRFPNVGSPAAEADVSAAEYQFQCDVVGVNEETDPRHLHPRPREPLIYSEVPQASRWPARESSTSALDSSKLKSGHAPDSAWAGKSWMDLSRPSPVDRPRHQAKNVRQSV